MSKKIVGQINRIFLIDDDRALNAIHSKILRTAGYKNQITVFENAQLALSEIEELISARHDELPQVIFLDIQMPGIDGWEFLKIFEKLTLPLAERSNVYMLSSVIDSSSEMRAKSHRSVRGFIPKPLTREYLESLFSFTE